MLSPDTFLPLAERTGAMRALTREVLDLAHGQQQAWRQAGRQLGVAVNISGANLLDAQLTGDLVELLDRHATRRGARLLELIEDTIMAIPSG